MSACGLACSRGIKKLFTGLNFTIQRGEITAILGANGAGKSTLLSILVQLAPSDCRMEGHVFLHHRELSAWKRRDLSQHIALLQQTPQAPMDMTVREAVLLGRSPWQDALGHASDQDSLVVDQAMKEAGIDILENHTIESLSGGELRRTFLAQVLAQSPEILLLDEPTAFLDMKQQTAILHTVFKKKHLGMASVIVLHDPNLAAAADQVILLFPDGHAEAGPPAELLTPERLSKIYGIQIQMLRDNTTRQTAFIQNQAIDKMDTSS